MEEHYVQFKKVDHGTSGAPMIKITIRAEQLHRDDDTAPGQVDKCNH